MKVVIVDDEFLARENLKAKLNQLEINIEVIGEASNVDEAIELLKKVQVDIVFLDITMPKKDGFELLMEYETLPFEVVFVTAHHEYAIKAFTNLAIGYITKPIDNEILQKVVSNVDQRLYKSKGYNELAALKILLNSKQKKRIAIPVNSGFEVVEYKNIVYLEAKDGYVTFHLIGGKLKLSSKNLNFFEEQLDQTTFVQVHRSFIVNSTYVKAYKKSGKIVMINEIEISVGRSYKQNFIHSFN